jgi:hypothetical protein
MKIDYYQKYLKYKNKYLELKGAGFEKISEERRKKPRMLKQEFKDNLKKLEQNKLEDILEKNETFDDNILDFYNIKTKVETNYAKLAKRISEKNLLSSDINNVITDILLNSGNKINVIYGYLYLLELYYSKLHM